MLRRIFLRAGAVAALTGASLSPAHAQNTTVNVYTGSDSNVSDFWRNTIIPAFEDVAPDATVEIVDAGDNAGLRAIADRALAALDSGADPQAEMLESYDPRLPEGAIDAGLWVNFAEADLSNYDRVNPDAIETDYALPYRGSQVLLAYDTTKLDPADAPRTWEELVAWIEANPGQFIYNRPDQGGSGGNFVRRAIHQANGLDPSAFTVDNYSEDYAAETLQPAWDVLNDLAPSLYEEGAYTSGNTQSIQLLAQGVVTMTPVWSDQVLQAIDQGVLPETTGLVQLEDLALPGSFSRAAIFSNAANRDTAIQLADFLLTEEIQSAILTELGGFPGVSWDYVDPALRERFADVIPTSIPTFPGGEWEAAINDGWYRNVAPGIARE